MTSGHRSLEVGGADDTQCVSVIFNPVSGQSDPEERKQLITDAFAQHNCTCQFSATTKEIGAKALAEQAVREGAKRIVVSGGDGTVIAAISALVGTGIPVAVLPAGTGNLLALNLGIPLTLPEAVPLALTGSPFALDLARTDTGHHFAIMGGIGMDAQIIKDADRSSKNKLGIFAYFLATAKNLARRRIPVRIYLDEKPPISRRAKSVLIANMGKMTGGLEAIPNALPNDGLLDVGVLRTRTAGEWLRLLGHILRRKAHEDPGLDVYQARTVRIQTRFSQPVQFDGEEGGHTTDLTIEVLPDAVHILIPADAPVLDGSERDNSPPAT